MLRDFTRYVLVLFNKFYSAVLSKGKEELTRQTIWGKTINRPEVILMCEKKKWNSSFDHKTYKKYFTVSLAAKGAPPFAPKIISL